MLEWMLRVWAKQLEHKDPKTTIENKLKWKNE